MSYNSRSLFQRVKMGTAGLLLIWVTVSIHYGTGSKCLTRDTYPVVKDGKTITCWLCQPGTKFVEDCPQDHTTAICTPCGTETFESCYNRSPFCADCTHVCPPRFEHVRTCNVTHDSTCECQDGMYRRDSYTCLNHTVCQPGEQVQRFGTQYKNTECVPCPRGTYSTTGNSSQCQKCRVCTWSQQEKPPCNGTGDAVCTEDSGVLSGIVIGVVVPVLVLGTVSVWCYIKRRKRNYRQQQPAVEMVNAELPGVPDRDYDVVYDDMEDSTRFSGEHSQNSSTRTPQSDTRTPLNEVIVNQFYSNAGNGTDMHTSDSVREGHGQVSTPDPGREGATSSYTGSNSDSYTPTEATGQGVDHPKNQVDHDVSVKLRCRAEMCTDEMFLWLKAKMPIGKKMFIFCRLFGDNDAVQEHEEIHSKNIRLQMYTLLLRWRDTLGLAATADKLVNALDKEECETIANEFMNEFKLHEN